MSQRLGMFIHMEDVSKSKFIKNLHERVKHQIQQQIERYTKHTNKGKREVIFKERDWVWLYLSKDRFPKQRNSKLNFRGNGPFQVVKRINNNPYGLDLPNEYEVNSTFNICDIIPFVGSTYDEANPPYLRSNHFQKEGNDGITPSQETNHKSHGQKDIRTLIFL